MSIKDISSMVSSTVALSIGAVVLSQVTDSIPAVGGSIDWKNKNWNPNIGTISEVKVSNKKLTRSELSKAYALSKKPKRIRKTRILTLEQKIEYLLSRI